MTSGLYIAASGLAAHQFQTDLAAHNLANLDTAGYRQRSALFAEAVAAAGGGAGAAGTGVSVQATVLDRRAGSVVVTGRSLDLAVEGEGFFRLLGPDGDRYTRSGRFTLAPDGTIVGPDGLPLAGAEGPIQGPADTETLSVTPDGTVLAHRSGQEARPLGQLLLALPPAPAAMEPVGGNLWQAMVPPAVVAPGQEGAGTVTAGALERGNVDMTDEMAALMRSVRFYQFSARAVQTADDMAGAAVALWRS